MSVSDSDLVVHRYLELVKKTVLNEVYLDDELRLTYLRDCLDGKQKFDYAVLHDIRSRKRDEYKALKASRLIGRFPNRDIHRSGFSHTMVGRKRLDGLHDCLDLLRNRGVTGDFVECGIWRGGCCIFMAAYAEIYGINDCRIIAADSFDGLPRSIHPADVSLDLSKSVFPELAVSLATVQENFMTYGLATDNVVFLQGWFKDTLPNAPINQIALLRLDGDLYESTMDCLTVLYDKVSIGGIIVIDDWGVLPPCRKAVEDFFTRRGEPLPEVTEIDWSGVYWVKNN